MRELAPMVGKTGEHVYRALGVPGPIISNLRTRPVGKVREWQSGLLAGLSTRITNVRCYFEENETPEEAAAGYAECAGHLQAEFDALTEARVILCVGGDAMRVVLGRDDASKLHGSVWTRDEADAMRAVGAASPLRLPPAVHTVVACFHPSFAMHGFPQAWPLIYKTIQRAKTWSLRESGPKREFKLNLAPTVADLQKVLADAAEHGTLLSIDVETARDNFTAIRMCGIAYTDDAALVFPWVEPFIGAFKDGMAKPGVPKCGHNFAFDEKAFLAHGIALAPPVFNTIDAEALLRPAFKGAAERRWLALSTCLQYNLDDWPYHKDPEELETRAFYRVALGIPESQTEEAYCALDCIGTRRLLHAQVPKIRALGMGHLFGDVVTPAGPPLVRMEMAGVLIDEEKRASEKKAALARKEELTTEIQAEADIFHQARRAKTQAQVDLITEAMKNELATYPLFTTPSEEGGLLAPCLGHSEYRGLTKREKCIGCARVYRAATGLRGKIRGFRSAATSLRAKVKRLGEHFLVGSDPAWRLLLFDKTLGFGLEPVATTEKKKLPKVDDESIEELQQIHPEIDLLGKRMEFQHLRRRLGIILEVPVDEGGYAHFAFSLHRTSTGRSSSGSDDTESRKYRASDGGNAQNWRDEDRALVVAGPGRVWASADFEQIELRTMAWRAQDLKLLAALRDGADIHSRNAARMFGIEQSQARVVKARLEGREQPARQAGKKVTHMADYGAQAEKIGKTVRPWQGAPFGEVEAYVRRPENRALAFVALRKLNRVRLEHRTLAVIERLTGDAPSHFILYGIANTITAKGWIEAYFAEWPRMREYQEELITRASSDGFITNAWGRRMTIFDWRYHSDGTNRRPKDPNDVIAFPGQSDAGEIAKACLPGMEGIFEMIGGQMRLFVHDSFDGDIPDGKRDDFIEYAKPLMEREWPEMGEIPGFGLFSCPTAFAFGTNWGKWDEKKNPGGLREWKG